MRHRPSHRPVWGLVKHRKGVQRRWTVQILHNRLWQSLWPLLHWRGAAAPTAVSQTLPCKQSWSKAEGTRLQWKESPGGRRKAGVTVSIPEGALCGWTACLFQWLLKVTRRGERRGGPAPKDQAWGPESCSSSAVSWPSFGFSISKLLTPALGHLTQYQLYNKIGTVDYLPALLLFLSFKLVRNLPRKRMEFIKFV